MRTKQVSTFAAGMLALGLLTGCAAEGQPTPMPGPDESVSQLADLEPTSRTYLWQQDIVVEREAIDALLHDNDLPLLFTDAESWEAWWSEVPEELRDETFQSLDPEFDGEVLVIASFGSCPPQSIRFNTDGAGEIVYDTVTSESSEEGQMACAWDPQAVYAYEFSLADLGVDSADSVTLSLLPQ